ncbi:hypothetical protein [Paractinoplanes rishiriensis]|uniref:Uncharacterized protein n=1 Tax=Paractinoplanes rishiriensis TaxID=1050105 RepID=A0A919JW36_9ACTN|nr:hypothetical protein [Actinoplanes rishiriensis]GIE94649.1 hypothetical protein Ari01nite_21140 [Actinoplanes rishiriensis]
MPSLLVRCDVPDGDPQQADVPGGTDEMDENVCGGCGGGEIGDIHGVLPGLVDLGGGRGAAELDSC